LTVVDWDAEEVGFSDERRLWTRGAHVHHVLNTVLLQTQTHTGIGCAQNNVKEDEDILGRVAVLRRRGLLLQTE